MVKCAPRPIPPLDTFQFAFNDVAGGVGVEQLCCLQQLKVMKCRQRWFW
jgi:hypothetical protein